MTPSDLVSRRVITGRIDERLADIAPRLKLGGTHHCVVLDEANRRFVGLVQLADIIGRSAAGNRILGDLVGEVQPVLVRPHDTAAHIAELFERYELTEAVLVEGDGNYLGLITAQSVLEWVRQECRRTEADLAEALERARQASAAKDNLIAAVSHELRTPLTPVLLVASTGAVDPALPSNARKDFAMIADHIAQEARLVDELLQQGQLLRGDLAMRRQPAAVHELLREVIHQARASLESKEILFSLELSPTEPQVKGDRMRLGRVFSELLANAIRFTPARGRVGVSTVTDVHGAYVSIQFADSGAGFSPEEMARMFEPFGDPARRAGDLGLGLSIARGLVELHAGELRVESKGRDQGAAFVVKLPLWNGSEPTHKPSGEMPDAGENRAQGHRFPPPSPDSDQRANLLAS